MMPLECASIRSIARWVLPVLVGPSTAVTPEPRARFWPRSLVKAADGEKAIFYGCFYWQRASTSIIARHLSQIATILGAPGTLRNGVRTNRARIADSCPFPASFTQHLAAMISGRH